MINLKRTLLVATLALSFPLTTSLTPTSTAHAATWHKGTPKILRGHWRGKKKTVKQIKYTGHASLNIKAKSLVNTPALPPKDSNYSAKLHYKKTGKTTYTITGREYNNAPQKGYKITFKFKVYNHHKISFKQVQGRSDGNGIFYKR